MNWTKIPVLVFGIALCHFSGPFAHAGIIPPPTAIAHEMLSETVPLAFPPADFEAEDFVIEWTGAPLPGIELRMVSKSLDWIRVSEALVLPRGRFRATAQGISGGRVTHAGYSEAFDKNGRVEAAVALISGPDNPIEVVILRDGKELRGKAKVQFKPRATASAPRVFYDNSCSRFSPKTEDLNFNPDFWKDTWVFVGCRHIQQISDTYRTSTMELYVFWDNAGSSIKVGGIQTPSTSTSLWPLRVSAQPGNIELESKNHPIRLSYRLAPELYHGRFSLGLGPYSMDFEGGGDNHPNKLVVMPTLYGSMFFNEAMRVVAFGAITTDHHLVTDFGLYFSTESMRVLDRRFIMNLLLGGHAIGFKTAAGGDYQVKFGGPQGFETIYIDFLKRGNNIYAGGFFYPVIDGKSYINAWLRWGSASLFWEINYISWQEPVGTELYRSKSLGVTVGFPVPFLSFL